MEINKLQYSKFQITNPNDHYFFVRLCDSLRKRGQINPVHVRQTKSGECEIVDGHRVVDAMKELGMSEVQVYDHGMIDEMDALLLYLQLNFARAKRDAVSLAKALGACVTTFGMIEVLEHVAIDPYELESYVSLSMHDWRDWCKKAAKDAEDTQNHLFTTPANGVTPQESVTTPPEPALALPVPARSGPRSSFVASAEAVCISTAQWTKLLNAGLYNGKSVEQIDELILAKYNVKTRKLTVAQFDEALELLRGE